MDTIPYPGELKNLIKSSIAFSDPSNEYDYLKKFMNAIGKNINEIDIKNLQNNGFTVREIEMITGVSKSKVSRDLKGENNE